MCVCVCVCVYVCVCVCVCVCVLVYLALKTVMHNLQMVNGLSVMICGWGLLKRTNS